MIEQIPWFQRRFNLDFPIGMFPIILERLRGTVPRIRDIITKLSETSMEYKPLDQWSIKEHIGHLYDLESLWSGRIDDFLSGAVMLRAADLTNAKTHAANHNMQKAEALLNLFAASRIYLTQRLENIDEAGAELTALHPRLQQTMRLIDSVFFVAEHDDHHLAKIRGLMELRREP
jgi:uncharacterized damage-inducible protein DinB